MRAFGIIAVLGALAAAVPVAQGQLTVAGRNVQIHGFASQGFAYSDQNNFLTMKTSEGSFAFTEGGLNLSTNITDKFRVGAQAYARNIGELGKGKVELDWALADYRFKDWLGVRAGKVKTTFGLYNDTQDMEFLHTWALLPQAMYPADLRSTMIAHTGGDIYGEVSLKQAGSLSYIVYAGQRPNDPRGGYYYSTADAGTALETFSGITAGFDLRWTTPVNGLTIGTSWAKNTMDASGMSTMLGHVRFDVESDPHHATAIYADYQRGRLRLNSEVRLDKNIVQAKVFGASSILDASSKGWFASAAYRVHKRLELGTYNSRFYVDSPQLPIAAADHIFDQAVTARFDVSRWWNVKVEGHFMDGYGDPYSAHGFYLRSNPQGFQPKTMMFVVRTGWNL